MSDGPFTIIDVESVDRTKGPSSSSTGTASTTTGRPGSPPTIAPPAPS